MSALKHTPALIQLRTEKGTDLGVVCLCNDGFFAATTIHGSFCFKWSERDVDGDIVKFLLNVDQKYFEGKMQQSTAPIVSIHDKDSVQRIKIFSKHFLQSFRHTTLQTIK